MSAATDTRPARISVTPRAQALARAYRFLLQRADEVEAPQQHADEATREPDEAPRDDQDRQAVRQ